MPDTAHLLATKLHAPVRDASVVVRERVMELLDDGAGRGVTLVRAPAGFGKSTAVADWLGRRGIPAGWVSLDASDSDPAQFWSYLLAAVQRAVPAAGADARALLTSGQPLSATAVAQSLINDLAERTRPLTVVLDDYHLVENDEVHQGMALLTERRPATLNLVLISRSEPPFPLGRLRARGRLAEIGHPDLRFSLQEASLFLHQVMGLELAPSTVAQVEARTEGWVAGLQLAALSMRHGGDVDRFAASLSGAHRHIADFLAEEVLRQQPEEVREFLLHAAILPRMCGPLCDALTDGSTGRGILESLSRSNLFLIGLDDRQEWYRFHHLFAEFLQARLARQGDEVVRALHDRASRWFEGEGLLEEAVHHALSAGDTRRTADLVERSWRTLDRRHQSGTWRRWAEALPAEVLQERPVLTMGYGWALLDAGEIDRGEVFLDRTGELLEAAPADRVVADEREFTSIPGTLAAARAYVAQARGDMEATEMHAREALLLLPDDDPFYRGIPAVTVGLAQWARVQLSAAEASFRDAIRSFSAAGNGLFTAMALFALGELERLQGRLTDAEATFRRALRSPEAGGEQRARLQRGLGQVLLERGVLKEAEYQLEESRGFWGEEPEYRLCLVMADLFEARGDPAGALEWLDRAASRYTPELIPATRSVPARRARWALARGRMDQVERWMASADPASPEDLCSAYDRATLAHVQVHRAESGQAALDAVAALLEELCVSARETDRAGDLLDLLLLQVRLAAAGGDEAAARARMDDAMERAERENVHTLFLLHGATLEPWIEDAARRHPERGIARRLSAALADRRDGPAGAAEGLAAPLTPREVDILRLVAAGLSNKEIARQCFISLSTVKRHTANIYSKLDVSNRTRAAARADELGLL